MYLFRISRYMDHTAQDIVGDIAYDFYHNEDLSVIAAAHTECRLFTRLCSSLPIAA